MAQIIVVIGPPGAGKTTLASALASKLGYKTLQVGTLLRQMSNGNTKKAKELKNILASGKLASEKFADQVVEKNLGLDKGELGFVFDSYPRTYDQARYLTKLTKQFKWSEVIVFYIKVSEDEIIKRLMKRRFCPNDGLAFPPPRKYCPKDHTLLVHRSDDSMGIIKKRLEIWKKEEIELTEYYSNLDSIYVINGNNSVLTVERSLFKKVYDKIKKP